MENKFISYSDRQETGSLSQSFLYNVFLWMFAGLLMTASVSYVVATTPALLSFLYTDYGRPTILGYIVMFAPIGFVLLMSFSFQRLSYVALMAMFMLYSALMGASLSFLFLVYTGGSIALTFVICSTMFGALGLYGYTTKSDLTQIGNILIMALFGIIIAGLINFFLKSSAMSFVISLISVVIFTGLTAYDVQKLKRIGSGVEYGTEMGSKLAIMGALSLYLDFINLFLALLRLFGDRKN